MKQFTILLCDKQTLSIPFGLLVGLIIAAAALARVTSPVAEYSFMLLSAATFVVLAISASAADILDAARIWRRLKFAICMPLIWMLVQVLPSPISSITHPIWHSTAAALKLPLWGHITIDIGDTIAAIIGYVSNLSLVVGTQILTKDRDRAKIALLVLYAAATIVAMQVIIMKAASPESVEFSASVVVAEFGVLLALTVGICFIEARRDLSEAHGLLRTILRLAFCLVGFAAGLFTALSAGPLGGMAAIIGIAIFASILTTRGLGLDREIAGLLCVAFVVVAVLTGLLVYGDEFSVSWLPGVGPENVELVQRMVTDVGWFGSGAGTFRSLAKIYQEFGHPEETIVPPAIRLLVEWGWPAAICLAYVALRLIVLLFRSSLFRGRDYFFSTAASACVSCLLLNVVFYPSSMNPTVLVFADIIVGLGLAQSTGQHNRGRSWA